MKKKNVFSAFSIDGTHFRVSLFFLSLFLFVFFLVFPLFLSRSFGKPMHPVDWSPMSIAGGDYIATYAAANSFRSGLSMYKNNISYGKMYADPFAAGEYSRYSYPPLQAFLFVPLSFLPFEDSYHVWNVISFVLIVVSIALVSRLMQRRRLAFVFLLTLYGLSSFFWFHLERGQTDSLSLFFISLFLYFYSVKKDTLFTAFFLALACLLKVFPVLFIVFFLIRREYKILGITFFCGVAIVLLTGLQTWMYWFTSILPMYSNYSLGNEVDHSFAYLLSGFMDLKFPVVIGWSRIILSALAGLFFLAVFAGRHRDKWIVLELAILSIIMEIFPPWAANYKLVIMIFLFLVPLYLMERGFIGKKFVVVVPILGSFIFFMPLYNETYGRLFFSFLSSLVPLKFIPYFSLQKIGEYRASLALVFCLIYLLFLYVYLQFYNTKVFEKMVLFLERRKKMLVAGFSVAIVLLGTMGIFSLSEKYSTIKIVYANALKKYGREDKICDGLSVVAYDIRKKNNGGYEAEVIFKVEKKLKKNLTIYLHGHWLDGSNAVEGINFFPLILTDWWSEGKFVVVKKNVFLTSKEQDIRIGFFDMSNGDRFGKEIDLGVADLR